MPDRRMTPEEEMYYDHRQHQQGIVEQLARVWRNQIPFPNQPSPNVQDRRFERGPGPTMAEIINDPRKYIDRPVQSEIRQNRNKAIYQQAFSGDMEHENRMGLTWGKDNRMPMVAQPGSLGDQVGLNDLELKFLLQDLMQDQEHQQNLKAGREIMGEIDMWGRIPRIPDIPPVPPDTPAPTDEDIEAAR